MGKCRCSVSQCGENLPDERYRGTTSLAPRIYEGGGPRSGRGSPPPQRRGKPPQSRLRRASSPRGEAEGASHRSCPRIYEGGGPRSGRGRPPPQRESPFSHGFAVPAPPEGKLRALRTVLAPRIYEGGGPRSGRGSPRRSGKALSVTASPCRLSRRESRSVSKKPRKDCRPQAALGAELCDLYAKGVQIVRAAGCNPFVKKGQSPFLTVSAPPFSERRRIPTERQSVPVRKCRFLTARVTSRYSLSAAQAVGSQRKL